MLDSANASWPDIAAAVESGLIAILPVGAVEQHGAHLPLLTDTVMASGVAHRIAAQTSSWLLPAIAYGDALTAEDWPGTISIKPETLKLLVLDLGRDLKRQGIAGLVTVNGHFGNRAPIAASAATLRAEGMPVLELDYPGLEDLAAEFCTSEPAGPGFYHADEVETAIMLALAPQTVDMARAAPEYPEFPDDFGQRPIGLRSFNASGVFGDPRPATPETGERLIAGIVTRSLSVIADWRRESGI